MNIVTQLNEKLSKYRSPKVNWLTKRQWLLNLTNTVFSIATLGVQAFVFIKTLEFLSDYSTPDYSNPFSLFLMILGSVITSSMVSVLLAALWSLWNRATPQREKAIEKYTNLILKNFSERECSEVKIKLLKILKNEPYTPVCFLEEMIRLKEVADHQKQTEKDKHVVDVNDLSQLTVLIEQIQQNESANQFEIKAVSEEKMKNILKL